MVDLLQEAAHKEQKTRTLSAERALVWNGLALIVSLAAVIISYWVTIRVFEATAHLEDEMAYVWQAEAIARGALTTPSPPEPKSFLIPFVVDYNGQRFGKYPLGWPAMLGIGVWLGIRAWVNPLLAGLGVWLTYRLGQRTFGPVVGLLGAGLMTVSPFVLMNSGSLLSHPFSLVLAVAFALAWFDAVQPDGGEESGPALPDWLPTLVAALCLGMLALTRPLTAVAVGLPFGLHGLYLLVKGNWGVRRRILAIGGIAVAIGALYLLWQYAVTGDPFLNPYTLWWPYDKIGFGKGYGVTEEGHNLRTAWINTRFSLRVGNHDLFGWPYLSWLFLPAGLLALIRNWRKAPKLGLQALLTAAIFPSLVILYLAYWIGSHLFGPRYFYEAVPGLCLLTAAGIALLAGWPLLPGKPRQNFAGWRRLRPLGLTALVALLVAGNLIFYIPIRVGGMFGLYGVQRAHMEPFLTPQAQELTPALVVVYTEKAWIEYGTLLELQSPFLDSPFIFIIDRGRTPNRKVIDSFPERAVLHYYPAQEPYTFYKGWGLP